MQLPLLLLSLLSFSQIFGANTFASDPTNLEKCRLHFDKRLTDFDPAIEAIIVKHSIYDLATEIKESKTPLHFIFNYEEILMESPFTKGESTQAKMLALLLIKIFPNSEIQTFDHSGKSAAHEGATLQIQIQDSAETGVLIQDFMIENFPRMAYRLPLNVEMSFIKRANPMIPSLTKKEARGILGLPDVQVLSIYAQNANLPSLSEIKLDKDELGELTPKVILVSSNGLSTSDYEFMSRISGYQRILLTEFQALTPTAKSSRSWMIYNNTVGIMPTLYRASDAALIVGPVNMFEPLQALIPTYIMDKIEYLGYYDVNIFRDMLKTAVAAGAIPVLNFSHLPKAFLKNAKDRLPLLNPAFAITEGNSDSSFVQLLEVLEKNIRRVLREN